MLPHAPGYHLFRLWIIIIKGLLFGYIPLSCASYSIAPVTLKVEGIIVYFCKNLVDVKVPLGRNEIKSVINRKIIRIWQQRWENSSKGSWYYNIVKSVGKKEQFYGRHRKEEVMISRLRMGHTGLNSTLALMGKHENGMCDVSETVEHVLFECSKYDDQRNSVFSNIRNRPVSVVDLLGKGLNDNQVFKAVLTFLELTGLEHRI